MTLREATSNIGNAKIRRALWPQTTYVYWSRTHRCWIMHWANNTLTHFQEFNDGDKKADDWELWKP